MLPSQSILLTLLPVMYIGQSFFFTSNYEAYKNINPRRAEGTCGWVLNHRKFREWKANNHSNLLWLSAGPGCGKSVLSRALIDDVLVQDTSATICYFFFKDNEEQNSGATAICALLHQIFCAKIYLFQKHAQRVIYQEAEWLKRNFESLWKLLHTVALDPSSGDIICVIDALDECRQPDRNRLIEELERAYQISRERPNGEFKIKFLVTSRPYGDIERRFGKMTRQCPSIHLSGEGEWSFISREIDMVMNARVDEIVFERDLADCIGDALKHRLSEVQNRTYLWLHLTLDFLRDFHGHTKAKLLRGIDKLPDSVDHAYEKILHRCNSRYQGEGKRLLEIIVAAHRPLTISEIDVALEIHPSSRRLDELDLEGPTKRKQWIHDACGLFVSIVDSRVYLIHQTAREFLLQQGPETAVAGTWRRSIDLQAAHLSFAKLCISYLLFEDFWTNHQPDPPQSIPEEGFLEYSAAYWIYHVKQGHNMDNELIQNVVKLCELEPDSAYCIHYRTDHWYWSMRQTLQLLDRRLY
ncbi:unnamed protein product [Penicillium pancosmium]